MLKKIFGCVALLIACGAMVASMPGCEKKSDADKAKDALKDAGDAAKKAGEDVKDAVKP